jgi:RNA polymerase sigma-70 factor (ECF subfamily)
MDQEAWNRLVHLYGPLVYSWCCKAGLQEADAADVGQEVFRAVARRIGEFRHDRKEDSFRGWLRTIARNKMADFARQRADGHHGVGGSDALTRLYEIADQAETADPNAAADEINDEHTVLRRAVEMILSDFKPESRQAFLWVVVEGRDPADVAHELGISLNAVYLAKSRIKRRLRLEFEGLLEL